MTRDEEIMQMHARSGKFGTNEPITIPETKSSNYTCLVNQLSALPSLTMVADLLEEIEAANVSEGQLSQVILPLMHGKGLSRIAHSYNDLLWRSNTTARERRMKEVGSK